eukprot:7682590-Pyramimonas_sp.AAC.1
MEAVIVDDDPLLGDLRARGQIVHPHRVALVSAAHNASEAVDVFSVLSRLVAAAGLVVAHVRTL